LSDGLFEIYIEYITSHPLFVDEMFRIKNIWQKYKVKKSTPSSDDENSQQMTLC
jgi:hypothetical protein